jgi:hypothetical protein
MESWQTSPSGSAANVDRKEDTRNDSGLVMKFVEFCKEKMQTFGHFGKRPAGRRNNHGRNGGGKDGMKCNRSKSEGCHLRYDQKEINKYIRQYIYVNK